MSKEEDLQKALDDHCDSFPKPLISQEMIYEQERRNPYGVLKVHWDHPTDLREKIDTLITEIITTPRGKTITQSKYTDAIMSLVESYNKEMLDDVIENSGALVICDTEQLSFVPKIIKGLKEDQHKIAAKYLTPNTKKGE